MPWKDTCALEQRLEFIREVLRSDLGKAELCRRYWITALHRAQALQ
jgi:hypothetical protein